MSLSCSYILTCRKILRYGADGLTSPPKEGVLRIFIALEKPSPRPSLNTRTLGPTASTLSIKPPRATLLYYIINMVLIQEEGHLQSKLSSKTRAYLSFHNQQCTHTHTHTHTHFGTGETKPACSTLRTCYIPYSAHIVLN
jgi:hypothetical protein